MKGTPFPPVTCPHGYVGALGAPWPGVHIFIVPRDALFRAPSPLELTANNFSSMTRTIIGDGEWRGLPPGILEENT